MYPVVLQASASDKPGAALCATKEQLRAVPNHGIGFGLLRYLADEETSATLAALPSPQIRFNYLGQFDQVLGGEATGGLGLVPADEPTGPEHCTKALRSHWFEVNAAVAGGVLRVDWLYSRHVHRHQTVERLAQEFVERLGELIRHCLSPDAGGVTPSDFPLAGLDQNQLAKLAARLGRKTS